MRVYPPQDQVQTFPRQCCLYVAIWQWSIECGHCGVSNQVKYLLQKWYIDSKGSGNLILQVFLIYGVHRILLQPVKCIMDWSIQIGIRVQSIFHIDLMDMFLSWMFLYRLITHCFGVIYVKICSTWVTTPSSLLGSSKLSWNHVCVISIGYSGLR